MADTKVPEVRDITRIERIGKLSQFFIILFNLLICR